MLDYLSIILIVDFNYNFASMNEILIRKAEINDMASVLDLIKELAEFEKEPKSVIINVNDYLLNEINCKDERE